MPNIDVNGQTIDYPDIGDQNWGDNATNFAIQTSAALGKIGLSSGTSVDITQTLDVTGNTTLDANLSVAGTTSLTGNVTLTNNLTVTGNTTVGGVIYADDNTTANTPVISFINDANTGIGRSAADTLDFITNGNSRFRIESTGQIKAVYESTIGTDYNTRLDNGYLCRAWVNFDGTLSNTTGTYTRSGTTITCTITSHGLTTGQTANLDFTTGGATDGIYVVTVTNANTFTVEDTVSGTITTSNVTMLSRMIRASGNVSSITDNGTGDYTVNFTTAMPDTNYSALYTGRAEGVGIIVNEANPSTPAKNTNSLRIFAFNSSFVNTDASQINVGIFR